MDKPRTKAIEELRRTIDDALNVAEALGLMTVAIRLRQAMRAIDQGGEARPH